MKTGTMQKVKFKTLMRRLGLSLKETIGTLELLWASTLTNAPDGAIGAILDDEQIAAECDWNGEPDVLIQGLVGTGWLDACPVHRLIVHDWEEHCPAYLRGNFSSQQRSFASVCDVAKGGAKGDAKGTAKDGAKGDAKDHAISTPPKDPTTNPNQTNPNQTKSRKRLAAKRRPQSSFRPESASLPFDGDDFRDAWLAWCKHRSEIRKPLTETSVNHQLARMVDMGEARALAMMRHTVASGWTGLREPDAATATTNGKSKYDVPLPDDF